MSWRNLIVISLGIAVAVGAGLVLPQGVHNVDDPATMIATERTAVLIGGERAKSRIRDAIREVDDADDSSASDSD